MKRDPAAVSRFVETFASAFVDAGVPRMPSRVFAAILASDAGRLTAAELADQLQASPAAISGAVRYLIQVSLIVREREPGSRRDVYAVGDDGWYEAIVRRERLLELWARAVRDGVAALGPDTPAGRRLAETLAFFEFLQAEMPALLERWRAARPHR
jgi:DNA-binding transcriptional regulator GbsR (MarR family)